MLFLIAPWPNTSQPHACKSERDPGVCCLAIGEAAGSGSASSPALIARRRSLAKSVPGVRRNSVLRWEARRTKKNSRNRKSFKRISSNKRPEARGNARCLYLRGRRGSTGGRVHGPGRSQPLRLNVDQDPPTSVAEKELKKRCAFYGCFFASNFCSRCSGNGSGSGCSKSDWTAGPFPVCCAREKGFYVL